MSFWVYMLRCADNSYYTGHTDNLEKRIGEHETGAIPSCYTFSRRPLELVFSQDCATREEALAAERQIKGWSRKKKEAMMRADWAEVSRLAKPRTRATTAPPEVVPEHVVTGPAPSVCPESETDRPIEDWNQSVRPQRASAPIPAKPESTPTVRPEPVEGRNVAKGRPSEHHGDHCTATQIVRAVPVHPSTSSGRTEGGVTG